MQRRLILSGVAVLTFAIGTVLTAFIQLEPAPLPVIPTDWKRIEFSNYSMFVPPDLGNPIFDGTDSEIWRAENTEMEFVCDYGAYSNDLQAYANQPEYLSEWFRLGDESAHMETMNMSEAVAHWDRRDRRYVASVYFPHAPNGRAKLTCTAYCVNSAVQETARQMLLSIRFK